MTDQYGEVFSRVYEKYWASFSSSVGPYLWDYFLTQRPNNVSPVILDVGCGPGILAEYLLSQGAHVTGIDLSPAMVSIASARNESWVKTGRAHFAAVDAKDLVSSTKFDLIVATYDTLNHVLDLDDLRQCFVSMRQVASDDALLIFDLNTQKGLKSWDSFGVDEHDDATIIRKGVVTGRAAILTVSGYMRNPEGIYQRFREVLEERAFKLDDVRDALHDGGWGAVRFCLVSDLDSGIEDPEEFPRVFVVATPDH